MESPKSNIPKNKAVGPKPRDSELGLRLYYQPIVQPMFNKVVAYEALIRLFDKELHFVSPAIFIPIAEKSGLNAALGNWVIEESCRTVTNMLKKNIAFEYISLNVSNKHLQKKAFLSDVKRILDTYQIPPQKICFEISETAVVSRYNESMDKMRALRDMGFKIAIDDFGGEFDVLNKTEDLPVTILKLDRRFVERIVIDTRSREVTEATIGLALKLGLQVVAKAVEDTVQQKMLMKMGCNLMQGFLFGEPIRERGIIYPKKKKDEPETEETNE